MHAEGRTFPAMSRKWVAGRTSCACINECMLWNEIFPEALVLLLLRKLQKLDVRFNYSR